VPPSASADWYKAQPALQLINAAKALPLSTGRGVVVADINSKVDYAHLALSGHLTSGFDFISSQPAGFASLNQSDAGFLDQSDAGFLDQSDAGFLDQSDAGFLDQSNPASLDGLNPAYSHGSLSAGIIAAIAPDSMIMPLHAFGDDGHSDYFTLAKTIRYAVDHGAQIVNLNFGIPYTSFSNAVQSAVQFAQASNVLLVAPAGNDKTSQTQYPAAFAGVMGAGSTNLSDVLAPFSNYGSDVFVDVPGVDIISAYPDNYYVLASGTTLSAAAVAGTAALVRSLRTNGVSDAIARTAVNIDSKNPTYQNQLGYGRIDVFGAVLASRQPTTASINAPAVTYGAAGTVTVTVTSSVTTPSGNVSLVVDSGSAVTRALSNGSATFTINGLNAGDHTLTAAYIGQGAFMGSSATGTLHVNPAATAISVTSAPNASTFGQTVVLTASVSGTSPGAGIPPGTVTFYDGTSPVGTVTLNSAGVATFGTAALSAGAHSITAAYGATNNFSASTSSAGIQTVNKANTSTILGSNLNPSALGTPVTFTATVNAVPPGAGTPTGTITFTDGDDVLGTVAVSGSGQATLAKSSLTFGIHLIIAAYNGDANFNPGVSASVPGGPLLPTRSPAPLLPAHSPAPLSQIVYGYPAGVSGAFVIGDINAVVGKEVTFWGARWAKSNSLSGGRAPSAFKGFADSIPRPPSSGGAWTANPDNSSEPPKSIPSYMAVIVSSSITESGSKISGNVSQMVVVQTAPGYKPNPGHSGTGTVVAIINR